MTDADYWKNRVKEHQEQRTETISMQMDIQDAMINYIKSVAESEEFTLTYHEYGEVTLQCDGDLLDLEQIGRFCDVFGLELLINNRTITEDYMADSTMIKTGYLFTTTDNREEGGINNGL